MSNINTSRGRVGLLGLCLAAAMLASGCGSDHDLGSHGTDAGKSADAQTNMALAQKTCPVMGNPINPKIFVEHEGRKVYLCCKGCIKTFQADPAKYMAKLGGKASDHK